MVDSKHRPGGREKVKKGLITGINVLGMIAKGAMLVAGVAFVGGLTLCGVVDGMESKERKEKRERFNRNSR